MSVGLRRCSASLFDNKKIILTPKGLIMKNLRLLFVFVLIMFFSCIAGCGPSDKDVMASLEIINQGFFSVPLYNGATGIKLRNFGEAEFTDENDASSIKQKIVYQLQEDLLSLGGSCTFSGYFDTASCCKVDGEVSYDIQGDFEENGPSFFQFDYDFQFDSGKVKAIRFSFNSNKMGVNTSPVLWVNEKEYTFNNVVGLKNAVRKHFIFTDL